MIWSAVRGFTQWNWLFVMLALKSFSGAWPLYRDFVRQHIFNGAPHRAAVAKWNDSFELARFTDYWRSPGRYMIEIDGSVIGWLSVQESSDRITVENMFLMPEWQGKGVAERLFKEMTPIWRSKGLKVDVTLLKDAPVTSAAKGMLRSLGYNAVSSRSTALAATDNLTDIMRAE